MYREPCLQEVPLLVILEVLLLNTDEQFGVGVLLDVHVVLTDVNDQLVREDTVRRRRTFSRNSRWLLPFAAHAPAGHRLQAAANCRGGGRMGTVALTDRAYGLGSSSSCET